MFGAANGISQVVVMEPRSFAEMAQAIQAQGRKVVEHDYFDPEQATGNRLCSWCNLCH